MNRLKRVQELLCHDVQPVQPLKPRNKVSEKADAIVCITGIDSRNSIGADELFNFLFPNLRKEELQLDREAQGQYDWDDVVIVVKSNSVAVYCNPVNLKQLFPYFAQWENLTVHCLTEYQYEDQDLAEEYKISSFVAMLKGCKSVGVPYHVSGHSSSCHDICIEKWPLIQASALEEFGSGGFFTMVHDVVDVAPLLSTVYEHLDSITLRKIISTELKQFTHQWHMMCSTVGIAIDKFAGDTVDVSVGKILEPLTTYYSLGMMGNGNVEGLKKPFVLCGQNTNRAAFTAGSLHSHSEQRQVVAPLHMVVQSVSPCAPLSCARTYFLAPTFTPCQVSTINITSIVNDDARLLSELYDIAIAAVYEAIYTYTSSSSVQKAQKVALLHVTSLCEARHLIPSTDINISFELVACDNKGRYFPLHESSAPILAVKTASMIISGIPSQEHVGTDLGSIMFSECFVDSVISVANEGEREENHTDTLILTQGVPHHKCWQVKPDYLYIRNSVEEWVRDPRPGHEWGSLLLDGTDVMLAGATTKEPLRGEVLVRERGVCFLHESDLPILIPSEHGSPEMYDKEEANKMSVLLLKLGSCFYSHLPVQLCSPDLKLLITFAPKTAAYRALYSQLAPVLERVASLPSDAQETYQLLTQHVDESYTQKGSHCLADVARFLLHMEASSTLMQHSVQSCHLQAVIGNLGVSAVTSDKVVVSIVSGLAGSRQDSVADAVMKLCSEHSSWFVYDGRHAELSDDEMTFSASELHDVLSNALRAYHSAGATGGGTAVRVLVLAPVLTDTCAVVNAVLSHPGDGLLIGAVTIAVDTNAVFMAGRNLVPGFGELLSSGWVNNVVITDVVSSPWNQLVRGFLSKMQPPISVITAPDGRLSESGDLDAILSASVFSEARNVRARYLSRPDWQDVRCFCVHSKLDRVVLHFTGHVDPERLTAQVKLLNVSSGRGQLRGVYLVSGRFPCTGTDSLDGNVTVHLEYCATNGNIQATNVRCKPVKSTGSNHHHGDSTYAAAAKGIAVFEGFCLSKLELEDWMRNCLPLVPTRRELLTAGSISADHIAQIQKRRRHDALPAGWFYNGAHYVSLDGTRSRLHPCMPRFVSEHMSEWNKEVDTFNRTIDELLAKNIITIC